MTPKHAAAPRKGEYDPSDVNLIILDMNKEVVLLDAIETAVDEILAGVREDDPDWEEEPIHWGMLGCDRVEILVDCNSRKYYRVLISGASPASFALQKHVKDALVFNDVEIVTVW